MKSLLALLPLLAASAMIGCGDKQKGTADNPRTADSHAAGPHATAPAQHVAVQELLFKKESIPSDCLHTGEVIGGAHWSDSNGENYLIVSQEIGEPKGDEGDARHETLDGYLYARKDGANRLVWKIHDESDNPCDLGRGLISDIVVTDLDGDGVAENLFMYNVVGSCDVSPIPLKLMMHSGETKYAVRGTTRVDVGNGEKMGGEKTFDPAFNAAPEGFRKYAGEMWSKYVGKL